MSQTFIDSDQARQLMAAWRQAYGQECPLDQVHELAPPLAVASRAEGDAQAAWRRWHDPGLDADFTATEWPWYALLEQARVETLAGRHLPGMAHNLSCLEVLSPADPGMARLYQAARRIFVEPADPTGALVVKLADNPPTRYVPRLSLFGLHWPWSTAPVSREDVSGLPSNADITEALVAARDLLTDGSDFAERLHPLVQALAARYDPSVQSNPAQESAQTDSGVTPDGHSVSDEEHPDAELERPEGAKRDFTADAAFPGYAVFTRIWDEEYPAAHWYQPTDAAALNGLDPLDRRRVRQLAHRLLRRLLAARLRRWSFDREEGYLDSRRLARLVGTRGDRRIFRIECEAPVPEACVTLLVDQSGSMRGVPQRMSVLAIDLAVHTLEACQIRCEVLGFTTRFGADNPASRRWRGRGASEAPGRLNALRHIRYKTADQPWRRARPSLGLLLRESFGQENIDGEALDWAARRLLHQPQPRKVLVVLSDGSPYDEATASANGREYLENHLRAIIAGIEDSPIHLVAIGTGQDVGRFYRQAITVRRPEAVAELLFECLGDLLAQARPVEEIP